jgi:hypothetical protein
MKTRVIMTNTNGIVSVETFEGETIEEKVERIVTNKEPISDGAPMIYTDCHNECRFCNFDFDLAASCFTVRYTSTC